MILFLLSVGKWLKDKQKEQFPKEAAAKYAVQSKKNIKIKTEAEVLQKVHERCPQFSPYKREDILNSEVLAHNLHFKKDGEVFRLRIFIEDAENGSYRKLVFYKEDKDGFPRIQPLPEGKQVEPSSEYLKIFYKDAEILHQEKDFRLELKDGRKFTTSEVNGELVKLNSEQDNCDFEN